MKIQLHLKKLAWLLFLAGTSLHAQWQSGLWIEQQAYNWYFGVAAGIEFNSFPPVGVTDSAMEADLLNPYDGTGSTFIEGTGSISDAQGNLLFYTNGVTVWNANHEIMENGEGLLGNSSSTQSGLIVPAPNNPNIFYLFSVNGSNLQTSEGVFIPDGVFYSEIDMSLDGNMGAVTVNKNISLSTDVAERITAVHHANGHDVWVLIHNSSGSEFKAFLVSETGVTATPVVSSEGVSIASSDVGTMKVSPDGNKIAATKPYFGSFVVEVFDFNKETGEVSEVVATLNSTDFTGELLGCYGIEFSPNSRFLYASTMFTGRVYQFDVTAGSEQAIKDSGNIIGQLSDDIGYSMQLAPDGKIYIAHGDFFSGPFEPYLGSQSTLNVINFPNNEGLASGFAEDAVDLLDGRNDVSLPSFIQSYFASGIIYEGQCDGESISFSTLRIPGISEISWDFGDPDSGDNISTDLEPAHIFSAPGTYTVTAVIISNGAQQTAITEVTVFPVPDAVIPPLNELMQCVNPGGEGTFNLTALNTTILNGLNADEHTVTYYATPEDLQAGTPIPVPGEFTTGGQIVYAVVTNIVNGCASTIQLNLVVNPIPIVGDAANIEECGNDSAVFDLTSRASAIFDGLNPEEYSVTYYTDPEHSSEIQDPALFESGGQTIYTKVTEIATGCSATVEFDVLLLPLPSLPEISVYTGCSPFDLITIVGEPAEGAVYSFHESGEDASANSNAIINADNYVMQGNTGAVYIRVLGNNGCVRVGELLIQPGDCFIPRGISPDNDGKNDTFDLSGFDVEFLVIFNRYGQEVYSKDNYTNEWSGRSDSGDELPSGTYYYMIKNRSGENKTGWVYINRRL